MTAVLDAVDRHPVTIAYLIGVAYVLLVVIHGGPA
jgi:hypothetical protein